MRPQLEKCGAAISSLGVQEAIDWLEREKAVCLPIDVDVRDAKRRINAVKGPEKKKSRKQSSEGESSDGEST